MTPSPRKTSPRKKTTSPRPVKSTFVYYTGVNSHRTGVHSVPLFMFKMRMIMKKKGIPAKTVNKFTLKNMLNWSGAYTFNGVRRKNGSVNYQR